MMCSPLVANASSEEDEWHTNYVYELEEISLSEVSDSYIQSMHISHEATDRKNILSYDVSSDGSIIVTLKENTIHVYNSDLSLRYRIDTTYNATIIGFWQEDEVIVKFNRGNTALGLDEYGQLFLHIILNIRSIMPLSKHDLRKKEKSPLVTIPIA